MNVQASILLPRHQLMAVLVIIIIVVDKPSSIDSSTSTNHADDHYE